MLSTAIDKYMYITVNKTFDDSIVLKYRKTEIVSRVRQALVLVIFFGGGRRSDGLVARIGLVDVVQKGPVRGPVVFGVGQGVVGVGDVIVVKYPKDLIVVV